MRWFSSDQERRLWIYVLLLIVAIYSTLGLARSIAGELRMRGLFDTVFVIGFVLIIFAIVVHAFWTGRSGVEIVVILVFVAVYIMVFARMGIPEERTHLFEYGAVAIVVLEALRERKRGHRSVPVPAILAILITASLGIIDEIIQFFMPSRVFDPIDIGFNVLAAVMAVTASVTLGWVQRRARSASP
ncbi:MAG: VanZ family protein [Acidimicrobiia bacterium]|nr:VanZ family protein [Acidimicrobiia bacterium]NNL27429.1 VanZ family protein [Acidimicrobiia bacterium]